MIKRPVAGSPAEFWVVANPPAYAELAQRHRVGIAYTDDCLDIGLTWRRDYDSTGDAKSGNSFLLRLAFRGLGR